MMLLGAALMVALVAYMFYWLEARRARGLEQRLGESLIAEYERRNIESVDSGLAGRDDADILREALQRGDRVSKQGRSQGDKP